MVALRIVVAASVHALLLLILGSALDLLGGWNQTDAATGVLMILFLANPVLAAILLVVETVRYRRSQTIDGARVLQRPAVAIFLLVEAIGINIVILSQLRMH